MSTVSKGAYNFGPYPIASPAATSTQVYSPETNFGRKLEEPFLEMFLSAKMKIDVAGYSISRWSARLELCQRGMRCNFGFEEPQ
jgi:hypothetical protein